MEGQPDPAAARGGYADPAVRKDQLFCDRRSGICEYFADGSLLHDPALIQHGDPVADPVDHLHLVGDDHDRHAHLFVDFRQQLQNGAGRIGIQGGGRFVAQQVLGICGEGPGNGHTLLLTAGQLRRIGVRAVGKTDKLQQLRCPRLCFRPPQAGDLQGESHVMKNRALFQKVEALKDHTDGLPEL